MGLGTKLAILFVGVFVLCGCSSNIERQVITADSQSLSESVEKVRSTPKPEDSCLVPLREAIEKFRYEEATKDDLLKIAEKCQDEEIYLRVRWAVNTNEYFILDDI